MRNLSSNSIYGAFENIAERFPDKEALVYLGKRYKFSQLRGLVERLASNLSLLGLKDESKAIIYMYNCPQWIIIWLSLLRINAIPVPITPVYPPNDLKYIINDSGAETIFCMDTNFGYVEQVFLETNLKNAIVTNAVDLLPWWKKLFGKAFSKIPEGKFTLRENVFPFNSLIKGRTSKLPEFIADEKRIAEILYTGGTTGFPKGVPISNILFMEVGNETRKARESLIPIGDDIVIQGGPLYHIMGQGLGLGALLNGDNLILLPRMDLDGMFDHIQRYKVRTLFGVPAMYRMILDHDRVEYYDLGSLRYCFSAGDVLPLEIAQRWKKRFGISIYQAYGTTETGGGVSITPVSEPFPEGTVGKVLSFQKVKLVNPDTIEEVEFGEPGELLVSSENMVRGYWNKPDETDACFVNIDGRLWYRTKDLIRMDRDGWLFFVDRSADLIKHKGYRVAASKIEAVLQEHPAVTSSCVIGVPDEKVGERVKAFVVLKEDVMGVSAYELIAWCRERLAPYEVPQYIEFRDMLPKSKVGKLLRREMRADERRKLEEV